MKFRVNGKLRGFFDARVGLSCRKPQLQAQARKYGIETGEAGISPARKLAVEAFTVQTASFAVRLIPP